MAKVAGPLLSMDASGSVAGAMTFSKWKGRSYVRQLVTPANPKSVKQVSVRAMMKFLSQAWAGLSAPTQATYDALAAAASYAPFNAYIAKNLDRWRNFLAPSQAYPAAESDDAAVLDTLVATGGVGQVTLTIPITTPNQNWTLMIHRSPTGTFTPSFSNLVAVINGEGAGPFAYVDTPLAPGTYHYEVVPGSVEGVTGTSSNEANATAT